MIQRTFNKLLLLFVAGSLVSQPSAANEFVIGDITVHYSLVNSSVLAPKIATQYNLKRSKNQALLNISVVENMEKDAARRGEVKGVISNIFGQATTLVGHLKRLHFKEIKEQNAVYYIATFPITNGERLTFDLQVQPNKVGKLIPIKFKQQVFTD